MLEIRTYYEAEMLFELTYNCGVIRLLDAASYKFMYVSEFYPYDHVHQYLCKVSIHNEKNRRIY